MAWGGSPKPKGLATMQSKAHIFPINAEVASPLTNILFYFLNKLKSK
jgi:hypothetical protein